MRTFAKRYGYDYERVAQAVDELYPLIECGVSLMQVWIGYKQLPNIAEKLREWGEYE